MSTLKTLCFGPSCNDVPDTYTKTELENLLDDKQDTLTAGTGVTIVGNTISVNSGTEGTPTATKGAVNNHSIDVTPSVTNTAGYITGSTLTGTAVSVSASELVSGTKQITANGNNIDVVNYAAVDVAVPGIVPVLETTSVSYTPTESQITDTITPSVGYDGLQEVDVTVNAISDTYVGSAIERHSGWDLTTIGPTVMGPAGYYEYPFATTLPSGTAGTPVATKGAVSNHSVDITPSVTNVTGYITGSTKTGTAVTVTASELVSGTKSITTNGSNIDVTDYAAVDVNVSSTPSLYVGSGSAVTDLAGTFYPPTGYDGFSEFTIAAIPVGKVRTPATTITANPTINVSSNGTITADVHTSQSITPNLVTEGYVDSYHPGSREAGTVTADGFATEQLSTQAAQTIHPSTSDQTIASGQYLTGTQTIAAVTTTNLTAANIVSGVTVKVGDASDDDCVASVTGTASSGAVIISDTTDPNGGTIRTITAGNVVNLGIKTITTNGTYDPGDDSLDGYSEVTVNVSGGSPNLQTKTNIAPTTSSQTITPDYGYDGLSSVQINAMPSGSVTAPASISGSSATVSTGTNTLTLSKTVSVTPNVTTAGYVSSGTAGNSSVSLTASVTTKAATTYNTSSSDQTITSGTYLTGTQTIRGVTTSNLTADNIKSGVTVTVGDSADADRVLSVTGTYSGGGSGKNVQVYSGYATRQANSYGATDVTLTVSKTGTYKVTWMAWRSSSQGTMGTNLHVGSSSGTNQQTFTGTYGQCITLNNQSYTAGDVLTLYATSGSTSRTIYVGNLIIEE